MKRWLFSTVVLAAMLVAAPSRISRNSVVALERAVDQSFVNIMINEPIVSLGPTQAVYVDGVGVIVQQEVNLKPVASISPFKPMYTKEEIARIRQVKLEKLPMLKVGMRDMLVQAASKIDGMPDEERIILAVKLFHFTWEDTTGLPVQVVMQAPRGPLRQFAKNPDKLSELIQVREY